MFSRGLRRRTGFCVGDKGAERIIATFEEALVVLRRMPVARWRRPNQAGNWGIVAGVDWVEIEEDGDGPCWSRFTTRRGQC